MSKQKKYTILRIVLGVVVILVVAILGFSVYVSQHYKHIIKERLPGIVAKTTDSVYNIALGDIDINILTRKVTLEHVRLWPDTSQINVLRKRGRPVNNVFDIEVDAVEITGIMWEDLLANQSLNCSEAYISKPKILIHAYPIEDSVAATPHVRDTNKLKQSLVQSISVDKIKMSEPDVIYHFTGKEDSFYCYLRGGTITLNDWRIDPDTKYDTNRFVFARNGVFDLDTFTYRNPNSLYGISSSHLDFETDKRTLMIKGVVLHSLFGRDAFYRKVGYQKEIYSLNFPSIEVIDFNWKQLLYKKELMASSINITDPSLEIFFSRLYPPNNQSKLGKFPHQLLSKLRLKVNVPKLNLKHGHFEYTEQDAKTHKNGSLLFDEIGGTIDNITNIDSLVTQNPNCIIKLHGKFMHTSDMAATFNLLLTDKGGAFSVNGYLKDLNANQVAAPASALALADIKTFHLSRMDLHVQGNENKATGRFTLLYDNLDLVLQKVDSNKRLHKRRFLSLVANTLLLYPNNPMPGKEVRMVTTDVPRDPYKSFFNLIWKNIFQGAEKTALRDDRIIDLLGNKGATKDGKKKGLFKRLFGRKQDADTK